MYLTTLPVEKLGKITLDVKKLLTDAQIFVFKQKLERLLPHISQSNLIVQNKEICNTEENYLGSGVQNKLSFVYVPFHGKHSLHIHINPLESYKKIILSVNVTINDVLNLFPNIEIEEGISLYETIVQTGHSTVPNAKYITEIQTGSYNFYQETIENKDFYKYLICDDVEEFFFFQATMDFYSHAFTFPEYNNYVIIFDKENVKKYKALIPNEYISAFAYNDNIFETNGNTIKFFREDHGGVKYTEARVNKRRYFTFETSILVEKGPYADMLF